MKSKKIFLILLITFVCKIIFAFLFPVFADETYYYIWSIRPQLSYLDHPGFVSWLIKLGSYFSSEPSAFSLRILFILLSTFTSLLWIKILFKKNFSENQISTFLILTFLNPLLGPGSILATPDVPLVFFWTLSYLAYINLFEEIPKEKKYFYYALLGVSLGLGFCSKYHIVLFVISGLVSLFITKQYKKILLTGVLLTVFFGLIFSLPVLIWNYQNDWISFSYQFKHGFGKNHYDWHWTLNYFLGQILLVSPIIFISLFKKNEKKSDQVFSLTQIVFFTFSSFKAIVEANWPITSNAHSVSHFLSSSEKSNERKIKLTYLYWAVVYLALIIFCNTPYSKKALRNQFRTSQMDEIFPLVEKYKPLYGPSYQISSLLTWKTHQFIPKLNGLSRLDFFDTLPESNPTYKKIYVLKHFDSIWPDKYQIYQKTLLERFEYLQIELYQLAYE